MSNRNQVTLRQVTFYMVQCELPNDFSCVVSFLKIHTRIHSLLQGILGKAIFIQSGFVRGGKETGVVVPSRGM